MRIITLSNVILVILIFSLITANIYAQNSNTTAAKTLYFQVEIPDEWVYETASDTYVTKLLGFGPVNTIYISLAEYYGSNTTFAGGMFQQNAYYSIKNAPLDLYVKSGLDKLEQMKVISQKDVIVANETARQIEYEGIGEKEGFKGIQYYLFHNKKPYFIGYGSSEDLLFDKYLIEFEKMLKSFKWLD